MVGFLVADAVRVQRLGPEVREGALRHYAAAGGGAAAFFPRAGRGLSWDAPPEELRLAGHKGDVFALVEAGGAVCSASHDGTIAVWDKATLRLSRQLSAPGGGGVWSLAVWQGRLVSGHHDRCIRVWDLATGDCQTTLEGHESSVCCLTVCGARLVSGSYDGRLRFWAAVAGGGGGGEGEAGGLACDAAVEGHTRTVSALVGWRGMAISGSFDSSIRVWCAKDGAAEASLDGHSGDVNALVVHAHRLYSCADDQTLRVWALGTWQPLRTVGLYPEGSARRLCCLTVSGAHLVGGALCMHSGLPAEPPEVCVWELVGMERRGGLRQPPGGDVQALLGIAGELWAGVGPTVVVWGRR